MNDTLKKYGRSTALAAALMTAGAGAHKLMAQAPAPTIRLLAVRAMGPTSDPVHPYYYAATFLVTPVEAGVDPKSREVICHTDGNGPTLDGYPYTPAADTCASIIATGTDLATKASAMASTILAPNTPPASTDLAQPTVDAGQ